MTTVGEIVYIIEPINAPSSSVPPRTTNTKSSSRISSSFSASHKLTTTKKSTQSTHTTKSSSGTLLPCPPKDFTNKTDLTVKMPVTSNTFNLKYTKDKNHEIFTPGTSWYFATDAKLDWDVYFPTWGIPLGTNSASAVVHIPRNVTIDSLIVIGVLRDYTNCGSFDLKFRVIGFPSSDCPGNKPNLPTLSDAPKPTCASSTTTSVSTSTSTSSPPINSDFHIAGLLGHSPPTGGWVIGVASQDDDCNTVANNIQAFLVNAHATDEQDVPPGDIMGKSAFWLDQLCTYSNRVDFTKTGDNSWTFSTSSLYSGSCYSNAGSSVICEGPANAGTADATYEFQQYLVCTPNVGGLCKN
ncbi:hypothetical protein V8E54_011533 [Elaphomyces granulatus]